MHLRISLLALGILAGVLIVRASDSTSVDTLGWTIGAGIGSEFTQLLHINPKIGAGQNKIGLGGAVNFFANKKAQTFFWNNRVSWQFGVQKLGSGPLPSGGNIPFQKTIDAFRLNSKAGNKTGKKSKFYYAADFSIFGQLTPTYAGNLLRDTSSGGTAMNILSRFFSPLRLENSIGFDYKPNKKLSIFYSPSTYKAIIVADELIASRGVHGNPVQRDEDGNIISFEKNAHLFGSNLKINFADNFFEKKIVFTSDLSLFSNYLRNPGRIDVDWNGEVALNVLKGLQLTMILTLFYDYDVLVQLTDFDLAMDQWETGRAVSFTEQFLLKYNYVF